VWAKKISTSATAMACAACLATASTLPADEKAGSDLASNAAVNLAVDFSRIAAFDAIPAYVALLGGDLSVLSDLDLLNALPAYVAFLSGGGPDALADFDALSAVPVFVGTDGVFTGGGINALGGYDALSALDTFFGTGATPAESGVFTGGGLAALEPNEDLGQPGYAALSAIPALLDIPPLEAPTTPPPPPMGSAAPEGSSTLSTTSTPSTGTGPVASLFNAVTPASPGSGAGTGSAPATAGPVRSLVNAVTSALPKPNAKPAPAPAAVPQVEQQEITQTADVPDNSGSNSQNLTRESQKFEPTKRGEAPWLLNGGGSGADNGIRGWGKMLNKLGIGGGGEDSSGGQAGGGAAGGAE
jgi:hypothetical protein